MRIAVLGTRGIPANYSGFETSVEETGARLVERGHQVSVYCRTRNVGLADPIYKGMHLIRLPSINNQYLDTLSHTFLSLLHVLRRKVEVIHLYGVGNALFLLPLRVAGKKTVISVDGLDWKRDKWNRFASFCLRFSERLAVRFADAYVVDSRVTARYYVEHYGKPPIYIAYGAEVPAAIVGHHALEEFGLQKQGYILFVGRLVPEKGVHRLVEAFWTVESDLELVIVGDNPHDRAYVESLKRAADPRTRFLGYVYGEAYKQLCSHAYLYVQPSDLEGTSPALLGAMGCGNCVLVSDIPENLETIGEAGFSFKKGDPEDLARQLQYLIDRPDLVRAHRERARTRVHDVYSWEAITDAYEALFLQVASQSEVPAPGTQKTE